jgi:hypothetical protein
VGTVSRPGFPREAGGRGVRYGVGMRVLSDRMLLRQIRAAIASNTMAVDQIARLENVSAETLVELLERRLCEDAESGQQLRAFAAAHPGFSVVSWRTSRNHVSRLHLVNVEGVLVCGTPPGATRSPIHAGPCGSCAANVGLGLTAAASRSGLAAGSRRRELAAR